MDNLETIMQDKELVKDAVLEKLHRDYCPSDFGLSDQCTVRQSCGQCVSCWDKALKIRIEV